MFEDLWPKYNFKYVFKINVFKNNFRKTTGPLLKAISLFLVLHVKYVVLENSPSDILPTEWHDQDSVICGRFDKNPNGGNWMAPLRYNTKNNKWCHESGNRA